MNNREGHDRRERQQSCSHGRHNWFELLEKAVAETSKTAVAKRIGISRTAISLVMNGKYPADTGKIAARVLDVFSVVDCPYLGQEITQAECAAHAGRAIPTSSPRAVRHWKACQTCQNRSASLTASPAYNQEESCKPQ